MSDWCLPIGLKNIMKNFNTPNRSESTVLVTDIKIQHAVPSSDLERLPYCLNYATSAEKHRNMEHIKIEVKGTGWQN